MTKTYCISDIHAHIDNLKRFVETLEKDDRVFVLGDVVDKGDKAIESLELIMNDNRFTMLLGNHEYMMFNVLSTIPNTYEYNDAYNLWVNYNEGKRTLKQYNKLPKYKQLEIFNYIKDLPLNIPNLKVGTNIFYLVHSSPCSNIKLNMADVNYNNSVIEAYVWDRITPKDKVEANNQIIIAGHTPVQCYLGLDIDEIEPISFNLQDTSTSNKTTCYIDIDGGLAASLDNSRLIALCLDDLSYNLY